MYVSFTQIQDFSGGMVGHKKAKMRIEMSLQSGSLLCSLNTMHNSMLNELLKKIEMTVIRTHCIQIGSSATLPYNLSSIALVIVNYTSQLLLTRSYNII